MTDLFASLADPADPPPAPLLSPLIARCFLAVIAAVFSLLRRCYFSVSCGQIWQISGTFRPFFAAKRQKPLRPANLAILNRAPDRKLPFNRAPPTHYHERMPFDADTSSLPARAQALLDFWFGAADHPQRFHHKQIWFRSTPEFDEAVHAGFVADHELAAAGAYAAWQDAPLSALAYVMLLDQVPRNIFRSTSRAFASDHLALAATNHALARGFDGAVPTAWRLFFYLPLEHSEVLADQQRGLDLLLALPPVEGRPGDGHMTRLHFEIIARFGRFPHRNAILGRESTEEELAFLIECAHRFGQPAPPPV